MLNSDYEYKGQPLWYHDVILSTFYFLIRFLEKYRIVYWLDWGTLLGAVRNGKIIPWDYDIDIGIHLSAVEKLELLKEEMNKFGYTLSIDRNQKYARIIRFYTLEHGFDFHVDIYPWTSEGDVAFPCVEPEQVRPLSEIRNLSSIKFEGVICPCPLFPERALERKYGVKWRTPSILEGNTIYVKKFADDNESIKQEMKKYV